MEVLWICLSALLLAAHQASPVSVPTAYKLVSGLLMERVPSPSAHFYKEYVPLVYQFSIPRWNKTNREIIGSQNCSGTNYTKFYTTCPVLFFLGDIQDRFSEYLGNNQPLVVNLDDISAKPETALIPFDCELIKPHFEDIYMDKVTVDEYLGRLTSCSPLGSKEFIQGITNYVYNISGVYQDMRSKFYHEFWLKIDLLDGRVDAALWSNAINVLNSLMFQNYMMEANRWKMAVSDCEAGRIPSTVLPPSLLGDTLTDMLESLSSQRLQPSVSTDEIGNYYKSTLTDCTFTNDTFLVRILVPVIPKKENFLLVKISTLPFYYRDPVTKTDWQCVVDPEVLPKSGSESQEAYVLVDLVRSIAYESECKPGKFCHIPTALHPRKVSPCATAAFNWERYRTSNDTIRMDLIKHCPMKCSPVTKFKRDMMKHIAPFNFFLFNGDSSGNNKGITLNCSSSPKGVTDFSYKANPVTYGAQSFEISCNCLLGYQTEVYRPKPCNGLRQSRNQGLTQISNLAPVQWYSMDMLKQNKIKEFWNISEKIFKNPNIDLITQSIRLSSAITTGEQIGLNPDSSSSSSSNFLLVFLSLLCLALGVMMVGIAWRLYSLIKQLEGMGFNVKGQGSYNVGGTTGSVAGQQMSYRNMGSLVDTDGLLINEEH